MMFSCAATLDRLVCSFNPFQFRLPFCVVHQDLFNSTSRSPTLDWEEKQEHRTQDERDAGGLSHPPDQRQLLDGAEADVGLYR